MRIEKSSKFKQINAFFKVLSKILANISTGLVASDMEVNQYNEEENATQALLKLLIDARSLRLGERDFYSQIRSQIGINEEGLQLLWNFLNNEPVIDEMITSDEYKFCDLEWRLEAKVTKNLKYL